MTSLTLNPEPLKDPLAVFSFGGILSEHNLVFTRVVFLYSNYTWKNMIEKPGWS